MVYGSIRKRSDDVIFVASTILLRNSSNMNTLACVTSKQSMIAMRISATFTDAEMLGHDRMAHSDMHVVKEMIWEIQFGMKPIDNQDSRNDTTCA